MLQRQDKFDEAMVAFKEQVHVEPEHEKAWFNIGNILQIQGKLDEAIVAYEKQIKISPWYQLVWYNVGLILENREN